MYDLYTPIVKDVDFNIPYEQGKDLVIKGLSPLKEEYIDVLKKGFDSRWVDVYENKGKRSGAYSSGTYDSKPFILLNYQNTLIVYLLLHTKWGISYTAIFQRGTNPIFMEDIVYLLQR